MVLKDEVIEFKYVFEDETGKHINKNREHITLRRVSYLDKEKRYFLFLTNNPEIKTEKLRFCIRKRWGNEMLFKKMK